MTRRATTHPDSEPNPNSNSYERDPIIIGLTRPAMIAGVGWDWMFANGMVSITGLLLLAHPMVLVVFPILHVLGLAVYAKDPQQVGVILKRLKVGLRADRRHWSGNSYGG